MFNISFFSNNRLNLLIIAGVAGALFASFSGEEFSSAPYPPLILVPEGKFIYGSSKAERENAEVLDRNFNSNEIINNLYKYDTEPDRTEIHLDSFLIMSTTVTISQYAAFIDDTKYKVPQMDDITSTMYQPENTSNDLDLYIWKNNTPPQDRDNHPVVLVSWTDAEKYAEWLSKKTGRNFRLPTAIEWEKAARGVNGANFPWGMIYDPKLLNSADLGPNDTTPVGQYPEGASPYGLLDTAGQVFEWTKTSLEKNIYIIKGGAWNNYGCGVCRPAAQQSMSKSDKNILTGFRLIDIGPR